MLLSSLQVQDSGSSPKFGVFGTTVPGWASVGFKGMRMSELLRSVITCRGLHVDTLDRLPTTTLKQDNFNLRVFQSLICPTSQLWTFQNKPFTLGPGFAQPHCVCTVERSGCNHGYSVQGGKKTLRPTPKQDTCSSHNALGDINKRYKKYTFTFQGKLFFQMSFSLISKAREGFLLWALQIMISLESVTHAEFKIGLTS